MTNRKLLGIVVLIILIIVGAYAAFTFTAGQNPIRSQADVSSAVIDIGQDVENVGTVLDDIDSSLR